MENILSNTGEKEREREAEKGKLVRKPFGRYTRCEVSKSVNDLYTKILYADAYATTKYQKEYQNVGPGHASDGHFLPRKILLKSIDFERPGGRE